MKKQGIFVLVMLTVLFTGFVCGFFIGRNMDPGDVHISKLPANTTAPSTTTPAGTTTALPTGTHVSSAPSPSETSPQSAAKININTATKEELMTLPGIGEVLAKNIIAYREANGPFTSPGDLLNIDGIGEKRLDAIYDLITV